MFKVNFTLFLVTSWIILNRWRISLGNSDKVSATFKHIPLEMNISLETYIKQRVIDSFIFYTRVSRSVYAFCNRSPSQNWILIYLSIQFTKVIRKAVIVFVISSAGNLKAMHENIQTVISFIWSFKHQSEQCNIFSKLYRFRIIYIYLLVLLDKVLIFMSLMSII